MDAPEIQSLISYRCELTAHIIESLSRSNKQISPAKFTINIKHLLN